MRISPLIRWPNLLCHYSQICALAQGYKTVPATRGDISSGSQKGKDAISRYGMPDPDILTGKKRSSFSAPLK
ncbi:AcaB family transcriptional regulator [Escherichia coli]|nr:AcaB family transcriptional regulator [Escherichia coli]